MGRNQQVGKKTEGRDNHVGKGNEDQWKIPTPGFHVSAAALSRLFRHFYGPNHPRECDGKGSETHVAPKTTKRKRKECDRSKKRQEKLTAAEE